MFSTDPSASLQAQLTQGLPLKAVYCDSLVGFRYLYPRRTPPGSSPVNFHSHSKPPYSLGLGQTYRRFQMDFTTSESASQFIKLVSTVCPCTTTDRVPRANRGRPQATLTSVPSSRPRPTPKKVQKPTPTQPKKITGTQARQSGPSSMISAGSDDSHTLYGSSDPLPEAPFPVHNHPAPPVAFDQAPTSSFIPPPTTSQNDISSQSAIPRLPPSSQMFLPSTPIPSSSQMLPPTAPITPSQLPLQPGTQHPNTQPDAFLESLMQSPTLYDLSKPQLEAVVAQVIREEGFVKLVCIDVHHRCVFRLLIFLVYLA